MSPRRPYLLRALYDWMVDNHLTPHLLVDVTWPGVDVPSEYARDGQIVLSVGPSAVNNLQRGNDNVSFDARFSGVLRHVVVPVGAILAIYARENGSGTTFEPEPAYDADMKASFSNNDENQATAAENLTLVSDENISRQGDDSLPPDDEPPQPPRTCRPALRVVK